MPEERLQKVLAAAGIASRRASEKLITAGRVRVDGRVITDLGTKVDPEIASIAVDGKGISKPGSHIYLKVNKPRGILSDIGGDSRGRPTIVDLISPETGRVFPVGRLDLNSEGLILLTDDGGLAHKLTHPRFEHPKTYFVLVDQQPQMEQLARLREGIDLESGRTAPARVDTVERLPARLLLDKGNQKGVWLRFVLREGKKRQIRHMVAAVELRLQRLIRWAIGPLTLDRLPPGKTAPLSAGEVTALRKLVGETGGKPRPRSRKAASGRKNTPGRRQRRRRG